LYPVKRNGFRRNVVKKFKIGLVICVTLVVSLLWIGCAKPPKAEMEAAVTAVTRAENDADAVTYAGSTLTRAREALNRMQAEAGSKRYDAAKSYAAEAISAADKAVADGKNGATRARDEASSLVNSVKNSLVETEKSIGSAREVKNIDLDFGGIDRDFENARRTISQAELSLAGANYQDALDKGRTARGILSDITTRISRATITVSRKK
jgi:predicted S18 family serine protease